MSTLKSTVADLRSELRKSQENGAADTELREELETINTQLVEEALACTEVEKTMQQEIRKVRQDSARHICMSIHPEGESCGLVRCRSSACSQ